MIEKRPVIKGTNRPDLVSRPLGSLFHDTGSTGWGRKRALGDYKGDKTEKNFDHLNDKFVGPGEA
jgi:hypothetical protein